MRIGNFSVGIPEGQTLPDGAIVLSPDTAYSLLIQNDGDIRADAAVTMDGAIIGQWRLEPHAAILVESSLPQKGEVALPFRFSGTTDERISTIQIRFQTHTPASAGDTSEPDSVPPPDAVTIELKLIGKNVTQPAVGTHPTTLHQAAQSAVRSTPGTGKVAKPGGMNKFGKFVLTVIGISILRAAISTFVFPQNHGVSPIADNLVAYDNARTASPTFMAIAKVDPDRYQEFVQKAHGIIFQGGLDAQQKVVDANSAFLHEELIRRLQFATPATAKEWGRFRLQLYREWYAINPDSLYELFASDMKTNTPPQALVQHIGEPSSEENRTLVSIVSAPLADHPIDYGKRGQSLLAAMLPSLPKDEWEAIQAESDHRTVNKAVYDKAVLSLYERALEMPDRDAAALFVTLGELPTTDPAPAKS